MYLYWTPYTYVRLVCFLMVGILLQFYWPGYALYMSILFALLGTAFILLHKILSPTQKLTAGIPLGIMAFLTIVLGGYIRTAQYDVSQSPTHLLHQDSIRAYKAKIVSEVQERAKSWKAELSVQTILRSDGWQPSQGKLLLYFRKTPEGTPSLRYGDQILVRGAPQRVEPPRNPAEFDYQTYLRFQNIYHQHFIEKDEYLWLSHEPDHVFYFYAIEIRQYLQEQLERLLSSEQERAIASALILGIKDFLDNEVRQAYAGAGLMHILAVSGLHVGFVVLIFVALFSFLKKLPFGNYIHTILLILTLWTYAFLTGLSPSVMRAATMFSFVMAGQLLNKKPVIYNMLGASAFLLLMINPFLLWSVSFQLSYVAVLGIVYLQPIFYRWIAFESRFLDYFWQLTTVSLAAQLATFPLGLYYFHQFPNYFLISNLVILPFVQVILYLGVATLAFAWAPGLADILGWALEILIRGVNIFTFGLEKLPGAVSKGVVISWGEMWLIYGMILSVILLFQVRKFSYLVIAFICTMVLCGSRIYRQVQIQGQNYLLIYHLNRVPHVNILQDRQSYFLVADSLSHPVPNWDYSIEPFHQKQGIRENLLLTWEDSLAQAPFFYKNRGAFTQLIWQKQRFVFLHEKLKYRALEAVLSISADYLIIQNNAIWSFEKFTDQLYGKQIILDASNSYYRDRKLRAEADTLGLECYSVRAQGAWVLKPKDD